MTLFLHFSAAVLATLLFVSPATASVTADFKANRMDCVSPCVVYFDATEDRGNPQFPLTSSSGNHDPFHDLHYRWNFGDPSSGAWQTTGKPKNSAFGPQAAHMFEIAEGSGTSNFTVRLDVTAPDGSTDSVSRTITVRDPADAYAGKTVCISRNSDTSGCPAGAAKIVNATGSFDSLVSSQMNAGNRRILFHRGQSWTANDDVFMNKAGPGTIGAFGQGADPLIKTSHDGSFFRVSGNTPIFEDWRIMDLTFEGIGENVTRIFTANNQVRQLAMIRLANVPGTLDALLTFPEQSADADAGIHQDISFVETEFRNVGFLMAFVAARRLAVLGNDWEDARDGEHIIRVQYGDSVVISNNRMKDQALKKHLITVRSLPSDADTVGGDHAQNVVISDNLLHSRDDIAVQFTASNKSTYKGRGRDFIFERNFCDATIVGENQRCVNSFNTNGVTIRNNVAQMDGWQTFNAFFLGGGGSNVRASNNSCYTSESPSVPVRCVYAEGGSDIVARNNVLYAPNAGNTVVVDVDTNGVTTTNNVVVEGASPFVVSSPRTAEDYRPRVGGPLDGSGYTFRPNFLDFALADRTNADWEIGAFEIVGDETGTALAAPFLR